MSKIDIYQEVTDRIIEGLEGAGRWTKPWETLGSSVPMNGATGHNYQGINVLILAMAGMKYAASRWVTYKQAQSLGGSVSKGEKGTRIVFWKVCEKREPKADGSKDTFAMLKSFTVFNIEQCEGLDESKIAEYVPAVAGCGRALDIARNLGAEVEYGGDSACFIPSMDRIRMPSATAFKDDANHDATLLHELIHWTGHNSRLDRIKGHGYAEEELVAELGAAMAGAVLGVPYEGLQHEEYIAHWLTALKADKKAIFKAAKMAQAAVNFITAGVEIALEEAAA